jgi:hypothetical protein
MKTQDLEDNPFRKYLKKEGLTSGEFAILANTDPSTVSYVLHAKCRIFPRKFIDAIVLRSGIPMCTQLAVDYHHYREHLRRALMRPNSDGNKGVTA